MSRLIYDIGAHFGEDTAYYLHCGYHVIAVEANPELCDYIRKRFVKELSDKKLVLIESAVTIESKTEVSFFVSEHTGESSMYEGRLKQAGVNYREIKVSTISLNELFLRHGKGFYCKIDIEGGDIPVLKSLGPYDNLPEYFSVEICGLPIGELIGQPSQLIVPVTEFERLGYTKFKLIDQFSLTTLRRKSYYSMQRNILFRTGNKILKTLKIREKHLNPRNWYSKKYNYSFTNDTSGPFAEDLLGSWSSGEKIKNMISKHFKEYYKVERSKKNNIFWVDLHASR